MRTFEHFPKEVFCPICKTNDDKECTLIPISGTEDGNNCEAAPVHVECLTNLQFIFDEYKTIIYAII